MRRSSRGPRQSGCPSDLRDSQVVSGKNPLATFIFQVAGWKGSKIKVASGKKLLVTFSMRNLMIFIYEKKRIFSVFFRKNIFSLKKLKIDLLQCWDIFMNFRFSIVLIFSYNFVKSRYSCVSGENSPERSVWPVTQLLLVSHGFDYYNHQLSHSPPLASSYIHCCLLSLIT